MRRFLSVILLLFITGISQAQTALYVDSSRTASGAGTSWSTAYKTLGEALAVANAATFAVKYSIHIAKGTYYPTGAQPAARRDTSFVITRSRIKLFGGYASGGATRDVTANPTLLSGNIGSPSVATDNSYHVVVLSYIHTGDSIVFDGLTIADGRADGPTVTDTVNGLLFYRNYGGGMYNRRVAGKLCLNNCIIRNNFATNSGGGMCQDSVLFTYITGSAFTANTANGSGGGIYQGNNFGNPYLWVTGSTFTGNTGLGGGGIYNRRFASPASVISNCTFMNNTAGTSSVGSGGAMYSGCSNGPADLITNCTFTGNTAAYGGGLFLNNGAFASAGADFLRNCTFTGNAARLQGGGLYNYADNLTYTVNQCTFTNNKAASLGGGVYNITDPNGTGTFTNCTFTADSAATGGAMYNTGRTSYTHCSFTQNKANKGAGIYNISPAGGTIAYDTFVANQAAISGGAISSVGATTAHLISNSLFSGNKAGVSGGALHDSATAFTMTNCTLAHDTASTGNGIYNTAASNPVITSSIIWEGGTGIADAGTSTTTVSYSTVQGGYSGTGNLSADPLFLNPAPTSAAPTASGDYRILSCSPAVNSGINYGSYTGILDLAGQPRLTGTTVDQGAFENQGVSVTPNTGNTTICAGATSQLSNATAGGTWQSSNPLTATVSSTGLVTAVAAGSVTVSYAIPLGNGCNGIAASTVTVSALPNIAPVTGTDTICSHGTAQWRNTTGSGVWTSSDTAVATVSSTGLVTARAVGASTIYYTVTNAAGCVSTAFKTLYVSNGYNVSVSDSVCAGATYTFGPQALTVGGIYTQLFTSSGGCDSNVQLTLAVRQAIDTSVTQAGAQLSANRSGAAYQWVSCPGKQPIAGATAQSYMATANGQYAVMVTLGDCSETSSCHAVSGLSVSKAFVQSVKVYPNPATGMLHIAMPVADRTAKYELVNTLGQLVRKGDMVTEDAAIPVDYLQRGIYFLRVTASGFRFEAKVVLVR